MSSYEHHTNMSRTPSDELVSFHFVADSLLFLLIDRRLGSPVFGLHFSLTAAHVYFLVIDAPDRQCVKRASRSSLQTVPEGGGCHLFHTNYRYTVSSMCHLHTYRFVLI